MCRPVTCKTCHKTTWAGCGMHIDDVKRNVPANQWCDGQHNEPSRGGFLSRMLGR